MIVIIIEQLFFSFLASISFGIIFNIPRRFLMYCGFIGMVGWLCNWLLLQTQENLALSNFFATLTIGMLCLVFSRRLKTPVIILTTPAVVPLVPGAAAYMMIRYLLEQDYVKSLQALIDVIWISGAIVVGLMAVKILEKIFKQNMRYKFK